MALLIFFSLVFFLAFSVLGVIAAALGTIVGLWDIFISVSGREDRRWKRRHKTAMAMRAEREAEQNRRWEAAQKAAQEQPAA